MDDLALSSLSADKAFGGGVLIPTDVSEAVLFDADRVKYRERGWTEAT